MRILMVSGEYPPMKGGVGRYSKHLVDALRKKAKVFVACDESLKKVIADPFVRFGTRMGWPANSDTLLDLVNSINPDLVHVQYENGLYESDPPLRWRTPWPTHSTLEKFYRDCPVPVMTTLHSVAPSREYLAWTHDVVLRRKSRFRFMPTPFRSFARHLVLRVRETARRKALNTLLRYSKSVVHLSETSRDTLGFGTVIYHGAEPAGPPTGKTQCRLEFGLPESGRLLLAFGHVGRYKGFDLLAKMRLPEEWTLVLKQSEHERSYESPVHIENAIELDSHYLRDEELSKLFFACDAMIFPYRFVSVSGVLFDGLAHGLPFVASNLTFFREFADRGLGIATRPCSAALTDAIHHLDAHYDEYKANVGDFKEKLTWDVIAAQHLRLYSILTAQLHPEPYLR